MISYLHTLIWRPFFSLEPNIVTSDSSGGAAVYRVGTDGLEQVRSWKAHDFEAWIAAFNHWDHNIVFTGELGGKKNALAVYSWVSLNQVVKWVLTGRISTFQMSM